MTDHPVIFSAPMVLALLAGRKTMTRRLRWLNNARERADMSWTSERESFWTRVQPGDRLWVRESLTRSGGYIQYAADHGVGRALWPACWKQDPRPSIYMPRELSRLTLVVTATKIERLQAITNADAIAEGAIIDRDLPGGDVPGREPMVRIDGHSWEHQTVRLWFHRLWDSLHGADAWDENPDVVALSFTVHRENIDRVGNPTQVRMSG